MTRFFFSACVVLAFVAGYYTHGIFDSFQNGPSEARVALQENLVKVNISRPLSETDLDKAIPAAFDLYRTKSGDLSLSQQFRAWGARDPLAALDFLKTRPSRRSQSLQDDVIRGWASEDPRAAWD